MVKHFYQIAALFILGLSVATAEPQNKSNALKVNYQKLISRADITLDKPSSRSEAGLPVGNGRMGSLVWTSPSALRFQINRVDVYANNRNTKSFNVRSSDYCGGIGYVDIDFDDFGKNVFTETGTS